MGCVNGTSVQIIRNEDVLNRNAIYYTSIGEKSKEIQDNSISQIIEIFVFMKNALPSSYTITLSEQSQNFVKIIGSASIISIGGEEFVSAFKLNYYFEKNQNLILCLKTEKGQTQYNLILGKLMGSRGQKLEIPIIDQQGSLVFQAEPIKNTEFNSELQINVKSNFAFNDFYYFIKKNVSQTKDENRLVNVYRSEIVQNFKNSHRFNLMKVNSSHLKSKTNQIWIEFYSSNKKISEFLTNLEDPSLKNFTTLNLSSDKIQMDLTITNKKNYTFVDYLRGGVQISLIIGIDFTASNGQYDQPNSLHFIAKKENNYEQAISSCGNIVAYYDYDQQFPVFGYGAFTSSNSQVSHCFNLNFCDDPNIFMIQNILIQYRDSMKRLKFAGPTLFEPIIRKTIEISNNSTSKNIYYILLILTDGQINDMNETIDAVVEASFLPISLIIIGIGDGDFSNMEILDADVNPLINSQNIKARRDIAQFVEFKKYQKDPEKLANEVLAEIPYQVVEYFEMMNIQPENPIILNL